MHFPDLATTCPVDSGSHIRAIGWLENGHTFSTSSKTAWLWRVMTRWRFQFAFRAHARSAWQPVCFMGVHMCDLCPPNQWEKFAGSSNVWIPTTDCVFVAPELVAHYVSAHDYQPPPAFVAAVLTCPPQSSPAFFDLLRGHGYDEANLR